MKCKRLCAWLLSLVMMFSLLPVSAAAVEHEPTIKWGGLTPFNYTLSGKSIMKIKVCSGKKQKLRSIYG